MEKAISDRGMGRGQQPRRRQGRWAVVRHVVDPTQETEAQLLDEPALLLLDVRALLLETLLPRPERGIEGDRRRERHVDGAVLLTQHAPCLEQRPEGLLLLLPPEQLLLVRLLLDD